MTGWRIERGKEGREMGNDRTEDTEIGGREMGKERMKDKETKGRETGKGTTEDLQKRDGKREDEG